MAPSLAAGRALALLTALAIAPLAHAQTAPRPTSDGPRVGQMVEFNVDARVPSVDGAMPLDLLEALGASRHLLRMDVQPLGNVYGVTARFSFLGMEAFRAWHDAPETAALLAALQAADPAGGLRSSLVVQRAGASPLPSPER